MSYLVQTITNESLLVPQGAFSLNFADNLTPAASFVCPWEELGDLKNFCRFSKPSGESILRFMALTSKGETVDFLEKAVDCKDQFSTTKDAMGLNFWIKSLKWPGFVNYFRANSPVFGHLYFGYGLKNADLHFTLN